MTYSSVTLFPHRPSLTANAASSTGAALSAAGKRRLRSSGSRRHSSTTLRTQYSTTDFSPRYFAGSHAPRPGTPCVRPGTVLVGIPSTLTRASRPTRVRDSRGPSLHKRSRAPECLQRRWTSKHRCVRGELGIQGYASAVGEPRQRMHDRERPRASSAVEPSASAPARPARAAHTSGGKSSSCILQVPSSEISPDSPIFYAVFDSPTAR